MLHFRCPDTQSGRYLRRRHSIGTVFATLLESPRAIGALFATLLRSRHSIGTPFAALLLPGHAIGTLFAAHLHSRVPKVTCFCGAQTRKTTLSSIPLPKRHRGPWYSRTTQPAKEGIRTYIWNGICYTFPRPAFDRPAICSTAPTRARHPNTIRYTCAIRAPNSHAICDTCPTTGFNRNAIRRTLAILAPNRHAICYIFVCSDRRNDVFL